MDPTEKLLKGLGISPSKLKIEPKPVEKDSEGQVELPSETIWCTAVTGKGMEPEDPDMLPRRSLHAATPAGRARGREGHRTHMASMRPTWDFAIPYLPTPTGRGRWINQKYPRPAAVRPSVMPTAPIGGRALRREVVKGETQRGTERIQVSTSSSSSGDDGSGEAANGSNSTRSVGRGFTRGRRERNVLALRSGLNNNEAQRNNGQAWVPTSSSPEGDENNKDEFYFGMPPNGGWVTQSGGIVYGTGSLEATFDKLFSYMVMTKEELDKVMPHLSILKDGSKSRIFHEFSQFQQVAKRELRRLQSNNDDKHNNLLVDDEEKFLVKFNTKLGNLISHVSDNILPKVKKLAFFSVNFRDRMEDGLLVEISSNITKARNMLSDLITDYDNLECAKAFKSKSNQINI